MPRRTKEDNAGWPKATKNLVKREQRIAEKMKGQTFENVVLKSDNIIHWNTVKRVWGKSSGEFE